VRTGSVRIQAGADNLEVLDALPPVQLEMSRINPKLNALLRAC